MSYDTETGMDLADYYPPGVDDSVRVVREMIEEIDPDEYMDLCYEHVGEFYSQDAATWCADIQTWEGESGHTFYLKDFLPCEDDCPCQGV